MLEKFELSRYALSKFTYNADAYLYSLDPDEECGESDYGGWYGRYDSPLDPSVKAVEVFELTEDDVAYLRLMKGAVLRENSHGFINSWHYENKDSLDTFWNEVFQESIPKCGYCEEELDDDGQCPECDYEEESEDDDNEA